MDINAAGIICEYNPFHNGHMLHISQTRRASNADFIICAMSGDFTQRGEPAIFDKYARAHAALSCGADLVVELPAVCALQSAQGFARGGVRLLSLAGVSALSFGSELPIGRLERAASLITEEPPEYKAALKAGLKRGLSFPAARHAAVLSITGEDTLSKPNAILGVEYLSAIKAYAPHITPIAIIRTGPGHDDALPSDGVASAGAIRAMILSKGLVSAKDYIPSAACRIFESELAHGFKPAFPELFANMAAYALRMDHGLAAQLPDAAEGLDNRLNLAAMKHSDMQSIVYAASSKRYPESRIRRMLICALLHITRDMIGSFNENGPGYVRVLGLRERALPLLGHISKRARVITTPTDGDEFLKLDVLAAQIYALPQPAPYCDARREFSRRLITLR